MPRRLFRRKPRPPRAAKPKREIPWPINVAGRLLGLQAIGFLFLAIVTAPEPPIPAHRFDEVWLALVFTLLAISSVLAALGILRLRPLAWDIAMLLQGAALLLALTLYLGERPFYLYLIMIYCITLVLNLNQPELRRSFATEIAEPPKETPDEF